MSLTPEQYRDIMNEYDQVRRENYQKSQDRLEHIYTLIPEIQTIDETIASKSVSVARNMLFHPNDDQKKALHEEIDSLIRKKKELLIQNHYPVDYLDPIYRCSFCQDTGYVGDKKCYCFEERILKILYEESNLTSTIFKNNFKTFHLDYYSSEKQPGNRLSPRENMREILGICEHFIRTFHSESGKNLLIHGSTGVGKTFLSTCIAAELIKMGCHVVYLTSYQLFDQLADHRFRRKEENENILPAVKDADLLIIDDLGTELNNSFTNSQLFLCINERILRKKSTIINTNYSLRELQSAYTERITSRLIQFYKILHIYGKDIRIKKALSTID